MWREFLDFDTYSEGRGSTVKSIITGRTASYPFRAIAGVANHWRFTEIGQDTTLRKPTGFAFGRLAWNPDEETEKITSEWIKSTWNCDEQTLKVIEQMMMPTWDRFVRSHSPYSLGLTTLVKCHYKAGFGIRANKEWKISKESIGNDRTVNGSDYVSPILEYNRSIFNDINLCPNCICSVFIMYRGSIE